MSGSDKNSVNVGFVLFLATVIAVVGLFMVGGRGGLEEKARFTFLVKSASNVRPGTKVVLDGVTVGQVLAVDFQTALDQASDPRNIVIEIGIAKRNQHRIREGTKVWLESSGLLGDQVVALSSGNFDRQELPVGSRLEFEERSMVDGLLGKKTRDEAEALMTELVNLLRSMQDKEGSFGRFLTDRTLYDNADAVVANADRTLESAAVILEEMKSGKTPLSALFLGEDDARALSESIQALRVLLAEDQLPAALETIDSILAKVDHGVGTLGRLVNDPTIADNLNNVFLGVREEPIVRNIIRNAEVSGRSIYSEATGREAEEARIRAAIAAKIREGAGVPVPATADEETPPGSGETGGE